MEKNPDSYFTELKYLFIKLKQVAKIIDSYIKLFESSVVINHDYIEYQKTLLRMNGITEQEFQPISKESANIKDDLDLKSHSDREIQILEFYYLSLKSKKIHLGDEKVYSKIFIHIKINSLFIFKLLHLRKMKVIKLKISMILVSG